MNLKLKRDNVELNMDYNYAAYRELKKVPLSRYNRDEDTWMVEKKYIYSLLDHLRNLDIEVKDAMYLVGNSISHHETYNTEEKKSIVKTVKLSVVKENPKSLHLQFDYDENVLKYIKSLLKRQWNAKMKTWVVQKDDINWLYEKINGLEYVDMSELEKFRSNTNSLTFSTNNIPKSSITPYPFQVDVANQMLKEKKIINSLEAGLGKTPITIMVCETIKQKALVITPASVKHNWKKEIHKINPDATVSVLDGKSEWQSADYVILNYHIINRFMDKINEENFNVVVFDEAHKMRGIKTGRGTPNSQRAALCLELAQGKEYVFPLTATPFINYTKDIFNLLKVINHPISESWYAFANTFCGGKNTGYGKDYNGSSNQEQLNELLYPTGIIRLRTEDHVDLPERIRTFIPFDINITQYNKAVKDYINNRSKIVENGQHLVYLNAMRMKLAMEKAKQAVKMVKDDILETGESVVIFTNYTDVVDYLMDKFEDDAVKITGDVPSKERQDNVDLFQAGKKKILVGNIDAAGEGITLTKATKMIVIDFHWSPVFMVKQMEKRIHRISQTKPVNIMYLYAQNAELDRVMAEMLEKKLNDASLILDGEEESFIDEVINNLSI